MRLVRIILIRTKEFIINNQTIKLTYLVNVRGYFMEYSKVFYGIGNV